MRHFVRTFENTVLTTDALIVEMPNNAGDWIFFIRQNWASIKATGINAMMTGRRDGLLKGMPPVLAEQHSCLPPRLIVLEPIE